MTGRVDGPANTQRDGSGVRGCLQRDPRWFEQPEAFRPERFLPDAPPPPRGAWIPFGVGPRVCIGQHFAMLEMTLVAALLLQRYTLTLP